jgi:hypothetical protein
MNQFVVLEPMEYKDDVSSCLFVKDFPGCPPGYMVTWNPEFYCLNCGEHIYEIVNRKVPHECRHIDADGKDRPVLDSDGEKTYYYEDAYLIICPRCVTYKPDDARIGEFDHKEMIVELYDQPKRPEPDMLRRNRYRPVPPPPPPEARGFLGWWNPIPPEALEGLAYYREDQKRYVLSKMLQQAIKAAKSKSHKDRPGRARKRRAGREVNDDYTYGFGQQKGIHEIL